MGPRPAQQQNGVAGKAGGLPAIYRQLGLSAAIHLAASVA